MLVGAKFIQKIALEQMLILAGEAGFDFVLLEEKEKKKGEKDKEVGNLLASYAIALFSKKEGIMEVSESEGEEAIAKIRGESGFGGVAAKLKEEKCGEAGGSLDAKEGGKKEELRVLKKKGRKVKEVLEGKKEEKMVKSEEKKSLKIAICTNETEVEKLMGARERFERLYFGKDYVKRNREYLNP